MCINLYLNSGNYEHWDDIFPNMVPFEVSYFHMEDRPVLKLALN